MATIVQKYGGTSVADAGKIKSVARRIADARHRGDRVVAVVSAMGDTTDKLIELAGQVSSRPESRELDALLSTGEQMSCTLVAMALKSLGLDAVSLSGAQAGIRTDSRYGKARIAAVEGGRIQGELEAGRVVVVAGFQGITQGMDVTTLGRGGAALFAAPPAAALGAAARG
ncbi:MAG: aspartate kinase, partial [Chloroflexi bacterium]|nr:aspartate kinase [Chloroflexota bacterium]